LAIPLLIFFFAEGAGTKIVLKQQNRRQLVDNLPSAAPPHIPFEQGPLSLDSR
jgi:hypothetical protein